MNEEELRKLARDIRKFRDFYAKKSTYQLQFENTAFYIDVTADQLQRAAIQDERKVDTNE